MTPSKLTSLIFSISVLSFSAAHAEEATIPSVELCGQVAQGEILKGHTKDYEQVVVNGTAHRIAKNGDFIIAFDRDQGKKTPISFITPDGKESNSALKVASTKWDIQDLKGVPQRKVTPSKEDEVAIKAERKLVRDSLIANTSENHWEKGFIEPVKGRISGLFGGQRIMNGNKMNPHQGTDIAAPTGTPVKASGDGFVALNAADTFYSGNVIVIDHGHGLQTVYAHLNKMNVKKGDKVKQGDIIGEVGQTGRVTGPHLHWGASLRGTRFNPYSLLKLNDHNSCTKI